MAVEKIGIEAVLQDKQFQAGLAKMIKALDKAGDATEELSDTAKAAGKGVDNLSENMLKSALASVDLKAKMDTVKDVMEHVQNLARAGLDLAKLGATSERIERRFALFAEEVGGAEEMLEAFQEGAGNAASKMEAMQSASQLIQMGIVDTTDEMRDMVEVAVRLGDQTQSVTDRTENFALMIANQSLPRLDSYGISSGTVRARIIEMMEADKDLTREQAFTNAVMEEGGKSLITLGARVEDSAMTFEIMEAKMADAKVELGQKLAPVFADAIGLFGDFGDQAYMVMGVIGEFGGSLVKLAPLLGAAFPALLNMAKGLKAVNVAAIVTNPALLAVAAAAAAVVAVYKMWDHWNKKIGESAQKAIDAADETSEKMSLLVDEGGEVVDVFRDTGAVTDKTAQAWNRMHPVAQALSGVYGAHSKILKVVKERNLEVIEAAMKQGETYPEVIGLIDLYNSQIEDSAWHIKGFTEQKYNAILAMEDFQTVAGDVGLGIIEMTNLLLDGEYANILLDQSTLELGYTLDATGYAAQDLSLKMMSYIDTMDDAVPKTMEHGDALDRYIDKQDAAAVAAEEAAVVHDKAVEDTKRKLEELVRAQDAAKEAAFRHREGLIKLAETLSGPGVDSEAIYRASLGKLREMEEAGLISTDLFLIMYSNLNEQFGFTDKGGRDMAAGFEFLGGQMEKDLIHPTDWYTATELLNQMHKDGKVDLGHFKDEVVKYETPAEAAARKTRELYMAVAGMEDPTERADELMGLLKGTIHDSKKPTDDLTTAEIALKDGALDLPDPLGAVETAIDDLSTSIIEVQTPLDDLVVRAEQLPADFMTVAEKLYESGRALIDRLRAGMDYEWKILEKNKQAMLNAFAEEFHSSAEPKDPDSPLRGFFQKGAALVQVYIAGIESEFPKLGETFDRIFDWGQTFGGLGGAAAGILAGPQRELQQGMRFIDTEMKRLAGIWGVRGRGRGEDLYKSILEELAGGRGPKYWQQLMLMEDTLDPEQRAQLHRYRAINNLINERNALEREYTEMQEKLARLQEAQQRLRFLEQQVNLLKMIDKHGLDATEILDGLRLGAEASAEAVLEAMTRAMEAVIKQAEEKLGLRSPSTVFQKFGQQLMQGMSMGIEDMMALPVRQSAIATRAMMSAPAAMAGISTQNIDNSRTVNLRAGGNQFYSGMDETSYSTRTTRAVSRALRGW